VSPPPCRLNEYDAGRCASLADAWLATAEAEYTADRWAARATSTICRTALRVQAEGFAQLRRYFVRRLRRHVGDAGARRLCLDVAAAEAMRWREAIAGAQAAAAAAMAEQGAGQ
jgi:hypothetical protein